MRFGDKLKKNFAKNLQSLRTRNELTQSKLVDVLNDRYKEYDIELRRTSIVSYEAEGALPRIDALYCIAEYFGKTIDQMISPHMDRPMLAHPWMMPEFKPAPTVAVETERRSAPLNKDIPPTGDFEVNSILSACVEGIGYRQFYVEFLKTLFRQLEDNAKTPEEREQVGIMFYKTFLSSLLSKSKYLQDLAASRLDPQEFSVFMAFNDKESTIPMVAKALELTEENVVTIFNTAQSKISSVFEGNSKSNLS